MPLDSTPGSCSLLLGAVLDLDEQVAGTGIGRISCVQGLMAVTEWISATETQT